MKDVTGRELNKFDVVAVGYGSYDLALGIVRDTTNSLQFYSLYKDWGVSLAKKDTGDKTLRYRHTSYVNTDGGRAVKLSKEVLNIE